jgi:hypothetical protein
VEIIQQYIVYHAGRLQVLYRCEHDQWFITSNGAFGTRETFIERLDHHEAIKILKQQ